MKKKKSMCVKLKIEVKDSKGKVIKVIKKDGDILTRQWGAFLAAYFKNWISLEHTRTYTFRDIFGNLREFGGGMYIGTYDVYSPGFPDAMKNTLLIWIGTGTTDPSVEDYFLESEAGYGIPDVPRLVIDSNTGKIKIIISGDITPSTTPITISEAGIEVMAYATDGDARVLICRDTFTPVDVPSGGSITVTYTFEFN